MEKPYFRAFEVDEYMVVIMNRVSICVRVPSSALEIFAADKATVDIDV